MIDKQTEEKLNRITEGVYREHKDKLLNKEVNEQRDRAKEIMNDKNISNEIKERISGMVDLKDREVINTEEEKKYHQHLETKIESAIKSGEIKAPQRDNFIDKLGNHAPRPRREIDIERIQWEKNRDTIHKKYY